MVFNSAGFHVRTKPWSISPATHRYPHALFFRRPGFVFRQLATSLLATLLVFSLLFAYSSEAGAANTAVELKQQKVALEKVRKRLENLQKQVRKDKESASRATRKLQKIERAIETLARQLVELDKKLKTQGYRLRDLVAERERERKRMGALQKTLATHVRSAYAMGRQGQLKLLLSQEDPNSVSRVVSYARYLSEARADGIQAAIAQLEVLEALEIEIAEQTSELEELKQERIKETKNFERTKVERKKALAKLLAQIKRKGREVGLLQKNEKRLQKLVNALAEVLAKAPPPAKDSTPFVKRKGRLRWPSSGTLKTRYGQSRKIGDLKWRGVFITAPEGGDVRAVSDGRVVFADWLRGFGLLLILEHGNNYMSLYGYNQLLHKQVGDRVSSGQPIASVGSSGGQQVSGVYLELRHNGRPVNPIPWFDGLPPPLRASR